MSQTLSLPLRRSNTNAPVYALWILSVHPLIVYFSLYFLFIHARIFLGHWPSYGNPDPKTLPDGFDPYFAFFDTAFESLPWSFLATIVTYPLLALPGLRPATRSLWVPACVWGVCFTLLVLDPFGAFNWYAD